MINSAVSATTMEVIFKTVFFSLLVLNTIIKIYLSARNRKCIASNRERVPEKFSKKISLADHQKAADYTIEKSRFAQIGLILGIGITILWLPAGLLNKLDLLIRSWELTPIFAGTTFFLIFGLISMIIDLPISIYQTFVIEEKYGFNNTTKKIFIIDLIKQLILSAIIGIPLIMAVLWIMQKLGQWWWIYAWVFLSLFQLFLMWIYPTLIAPLFNKFSELEEGEIKETIIKLLEKTKFPYKGLYVMDASKRSAHGNAYFTGMGKNRRIVFFDTLLKRLTPEEIEAVLAHELGHFKHKHILKSLAFALIFSLIGFAILGQLIGMLSFYRGHFITLPSAYMALLLFSIITPIYTFLMTPISSWRSRRAEYQADHFAATYSQADKLVSALIKLHKDNASTLTPDRIYSKFYYSHPPATERIEYLESIK